MDATVPQTDFQEPDVARIVLRRDQLAKFRRIAGNGLDVDATFAERIGVNAGQVSRVLSGKSAPGTRFIAGCLDLFGVECFADLFEVEPDDNGAAA
jgi:transcriptional regulator with XRE-family HTH domain